MEPTDKSMEVTNPVREARPDGNGADEKSATKVAVRAKAVVVTGSGEKVVSQRLASEKPAVEKATPKKKLPTRPNRVRETRIEKMMSKAELARRAGLSVLTIDRVEKGLGCRMDTKRKILEALGLSLADRVRVFGEEE